MDPFTQFFVLALFLIFLVTGCWPLSVPLMALAYKVRLGQQPIPLETGSFWLRSTFAALGLAILSGVCLGLFLALNWVVREMEMNTLFVFVPLALFVAYLPLAAWFLLWIYQQEELIEGLSVFGLFILLPTLPILLIGWLLRSRIDAFLSWLLGV